MYFKALGDIDFCLLVKNRATPMCGPVVKPLCVLLKDDNERKAHAHTLAHKPDILALTVDEGCRGPGINQITKWKTKASEGKETGGKKQKGTQQLRTGSSIGEHKCT